MAASSLAVFFLAFWAPAGAAPRRTTANTPTPTAYLGRMGCLLKGGTGGTPVPPDGCCGGVVAGSPDPATGEDRRSPGWQPGDLRSSPVARSGDRATTGGHRR